MGDGTVACAFHDATKHSYASVRLHRHALDGSNRPFPFKVYEGPERVPLMREPPRLGGRAMDAVGTVEVADPSAVPDLAGLARLLVYGAGVLRKKVFADGEAYFFHTSASAGALYPVEVYVACGDLDGLPAGVYHFGPLERALVRLRTGDHRPALVRAAAGEPAVARAPVLLILTGIPWRMTWKYSDRGYRHLFWDAGMILANMPISPLPQISPPGSSPVSPTRRWKGFSASMASASSPCASFRSGGARRPGCDFPTRARHVLREAAFAARGYLSTDPPGERRGAPAGRPGGVLANVPRGQK